LKVVDKFVARVQSKLSSRNVTLDLHDDARQWLAEKGYDSVLGARPLDRLMQREIETQLSDELLFGKLANGGHVAVTLADDALEFAYTPKQS
ncbi:MAG: ATP-dependent Clp protease ATP-binding subunit ClpA, partial [Candidatus Hydrogenedentota bacterium]